MVRVTALNLVKPRKGLLKRILNSMELLLCKREVNLGLRRILCHLVNEIIYLIDRQSGVIVELWVWAVQLTTLLWSTVDIRKTIHKGHVSTRSTKRLSLPGGHSLTFEAANHSVTGHADAVTKDALSLARIQLCVTIPSVHLVLNLWENWSTGLSKDITIVAESARL